MGGGAKGSDRKKGTSRLKISPDKEVYYVILKRKKDERLTERGMGRRRRNKRWTKRGRRDGDSDGWDGIERLWKRARRLQ